MYNSIMIIIYDNKPKYFYKYKLYKSDFGEGENKSPKKKIQSQQ